jgi:transcriptional regulator with XRE-family HTH domain
MATDARPTPGQLLREARHRHGLTQKQLAIRAGTTQSAISRIERDQVSPTVETLQALLYQMNEELVLAAHEPEHGHDREQLRANLALPPAERVQRGVDWSRQVQRLYRSTHGARV